MGQGATDDTDEAALGDSGLVGLGWYDGLTTLEGGGTEDVELTIRDYGQSIGIERGLTGTGEQMEDTGGIVDLGEELKTLGGPYPIGHLDKEIAGDGGYIDLLDTIGPLTLDGLDESIGTKRMGQSGKGEGIEQGLDFLFEARLGTDDKPHVLNSLMRGVYSLTRGYWVLGDIR